MTASPTQHRLGEVIQGDHIERSGYGPNYGQNYGLQVCSWEGPAPASTGVSRLLRARLPAPHVERLMG